MTIAPGPTELIVDQAGRASRRMLAWMRDAGRGAAASVAVRPEDFTGGIVQRLTAAFAQGIADGVPVLLAGSYALADPVPPIDLTAGALTVVGGGDIHVTADLGVAVTIQAPYAAVVPVTAIAATTRSFPGVATVATACVRITAPGLGAAIGDVCKLVSDDQITPTSAANHRRGEHVYVADVSGDDVFVAGPLLETYTTSPRIARLRRDARLDWDGPTFSAMPGQAWGTTFLRARSLLQPSVRTGFRDGYAIGLDISSCVQADADVTGLQMLNRQASASISGYLVQDSASTKSRVTVRGIDARHGYTTTTPTSGVGGSAYLYGRTVGSVVGGDFIATSSAAFDVHTEAVDVTFAQVTTSGGRLGEDASGAGIQMRGQRTRAIDCADRGSVNGLQFYAQVAGDCVDCSAVNFDYAGDGDAIRINSGGGINAVRPRVKGGLLRTTKSRTIVAWDCLDAILEDVLIVPLGSTSGAAGILLNGNASVTVRRLTVDLRDWTGTTFRVFAFGGTGNSLYVESARLINAAGKAQAWFNGGSTSGAASLGGLSGDAPSNVAINAGSVTLTLRDVIAGPFADNAAAVSGGLAVGTPYRTATGELRIVV